MILEHNLISWYRKNLRELPWRQHQTAYNVWLSEIILQQTQVIQGTPYYLKFMAKYPSVFDLANAPEDEVLKLWQGLGYYSRARNLHQTAQKIVRDFNGVFPTNSEGLTQLKGIGEYTAAAISSIVNNESVPAIDGNAYRVFSRLFDVETPIDTPEGKKIIKKLITEHMSQKNPGDFNQAVMELGATICKPRQALCPECPLSNMCWAYQKQTIYERPVKSRKTKVKVLYIDYLVVKSESGLVMQQRGQEDIWRGLYEFPGVSSDYLLSQDELKSSLEDFYNIKLNLLTLHASSSHQLTHRDLKIRFFIAQLAKKVSLEYTAWDKIPQKPVPKPIAMYLEQNFRLNKFELL